MHDRATRGVINSNPRVRINGSVKDLKEHELVTLAWLEAAISTLRSIDPYAFNDEVLEVIMEGVKPKHQTIESVFDGI
jgi:hypothetical protein